ncbi:MAG: 23S rRNA (uracil(1939)-C(5))-methyltransferase RlmD, partial [Tissierellia bacterium]|nr:23S rRNA (uracil(1939)-C(5))-methyltransferase RlmD [Tissierellia bacterium]
MKNRECVHFKDCGACTFRLAFPKVQTKKKQEYMQRLFADYKVAPMVEMEDPYFYRNKVLRTFKLVGKQRFVSGIYEKGTHWVIPIDQCLIEDEGAKAIQRTIYSLAKQYKWEIYDEDTGQGLLRHALVRIGKASGEASVTMIIKGDVLPRQDDFTKALTKRHPQIKSVYVNANKRKTKVVIEGRLNQIYGKGPIKDQLLGLDILISGDSFYQVNHSQAEKLYTKVMELLDIKEDEVILDAYCGIGTMALLAAQRGARSLGVDNNVSALADARQMKKINKLHKVDFIEEDATVFMEKRAKSGGKIDKLILDPPRTGTTEAFIEAALSLAPEKIVYVSCNPARLKEELPLFEKGYKVEGIYPLDLFPFTGHVECIALL